MRQRAQPFDDLGEQQGVEVPGLAGGSAQNGQDVLADRLGRVGVGQFCDPLACFGDRRFPQHPAVGQPEPAEDSETAARASPNTTAPDSRMPSCATCLARSACFGCGARGSSGNSSTTRTPALPSASMMSASLTAPSSARYSRLTVAGPTWVAAPASASARRVSRSSCPRRAPAWRSAKLRRVSRPVRSISACAVISVSASLAYARLVLSSRQKARTSAIWCAKTASSWLSRGSPYRVYRSGGGTLPALRAGSSTSARYRSRSQVT